MPAAAPRITIPVVGGSARSRNTAVNDQATVNFMSSMKGEGAKAPVVLETIPGNINNVDVGDGPIRTAKMVNSRIRGSADLYGVYGSKLIAQTIASGNIEVGTLATSTGRVEIARGRTYVVMVDGTNGYTYDGTTFAQIADPDFPSNPTHVRYIDGFFIVNESDTDNFYISAVEDPTSWNALDFEAASVAPDNALALETTESLLWIFGDETSQAYYNNQNADFPYEIVLNATKQVGVLAPHSVARSDEGIFFFATTPEGGRFIYRIRGTDGQVVSGDEQEDFLATIVDPTDAYGFIYKQAGKSFYVLQLSASSGDDARTSSTLVYNISSGLWETRELSDGTAWRVGGHGILNKVNIVGSRLQGQRMELSLTAYKDLDAELIRLRRTQIYHVNNQLMDWHELVIDVQSGVGNSADPDPILRMRYRDINEDWSDFLDGELGVEGQRDARIVFHNLGQSRNREIEITSSANAPVTIIAAYARVSVLED